MPDAVAVASAPPAASVPAAVPAATPSTPAAAPAAQPATPSPSPAAASPAPAASEAPAKPAAEAVRSLFDDPALKAPEGDKAPEKPAEAAEKPTEEAKPIEYKDFTFPEGVVADTEQVAEFKQQAAELGLSQEAAQSLIDRHATLLKKSVEQVYSAWDAQREAWQAEVKADPDIGGDKFAPTMIGIKTALQNTLNGREYTVNIQLPDGSRSTTKMPAAEAFLHVLGYTGAANNPIVIRALKALTATRSEGGPVTGDAPKTPPRSLANKIYGDSNKGT